ncbi:venom serine carboxypeptidase-like [Ixodes scapularis]|uniref:venom serine carboxypeptidase-like n=1 Tax=Ixodes scapularis TaxID=6945 RepID=UPI001A9CFF00|nr:venom serine carboxypeptidase-like [Ixodes scapularis]
MRLLLLFSVVFAFLAPRCVSAKSGREKEAVHERSATPGMFFSPYMDNKDNISKAVNMSKVDIFKRIADVDAYSGYISLSNESHLFFLLTKAPENIRHNAPLLLWLYGGPGESSMWTQFAENGPVGISATGDLFKRNKTLQQHASVIYLDQPAGAGLSIIKNYTDPKNYAHTLEEMAVMIETFMTQFLILFPEYMGRSFYVAGESYGARAALGFGERLRCTPPENRTNLTLSGLILGAGFLAPIVDLMDSTEFLYQTGLLNDTGRRIFNETFANIRELSKSNTTLALYLLSTTVFNLGTDGQKSLFQKLTGFSVQRSALYSILPPVAEAYTHYMNTSGFKQSLHVPLFSQINSLRPMIALMLSGDFFTNIQEKFQSALDYQNILLYTGQLDALFPSTNFRKHFSTLKWTKKEAFESAGRNTWSTCGDSHGVAGYIESITNFSYAVVLKAGHHTTFDEPDSVYHLTSSFIKGGNFNTNLKCT